MKKPSKQNAILQGKCPRCRQGKMFPATTYNLSSFFKMNEYCAHCGLRFEVEPGFFFGAMYISYAFSVAIFLTLGVILTVMVDFSIWTYGAVIVGTTASLLPLIFRYSRILFLHLFGGIDFDAKFID